MHVFTAPSIIGPWLWLGTDNKKYCHTNFNSYCFVLFWTQNFIQILKLQSSLNWNIMKSYWDQQITGFPSLNPSLSLFVFLPSIIYDCSRIHNLFQDHIVQERVYLPHTRCELEVIGCKSFSLSPSMCQRVCWNSNKSPVAHARVGLCFSLKITPGIWRHFQRWASRTLCHLDRYPCTSL